MLGVRLTRAYKRRVIVKRDFSVQTRRRQQTDIERNVHVAHGDI